MSMNVIISRKYNFKETQGILCIFDECNLIYQCVTIELPKIVIPFPINTKKIDCIPEGVYEVVKIYSPTKGKCFLLNNVPGRTAVEIHIGNYASGKKVDTEGCILPGMNFVDLNKDGNIDVADSTIAMQSLLSILPNAFKLYIF
jgi:hypothetical protein